jgi:hypothetical protein
MIKYFKQNEIHIVNDDTEWEYSDTELQGSDVEIHSKIYHALLRFQQNHLK